MLISCSSCKSKYLVNSADLKPDGRIVQCANCGKQWYQDFKSNENDETEEQVNISKPNFSESQEPNNDLSESVKNLPSTYVKEQKVSLLNSILVVLFIVILIGIFWIIQNLEINSLVLFKYYLNEFTFNLKLIFEDIAKIIHKLFN